MQTRTIKFKKAWVEDVESIIVKELENLSSEEKSIELDFSNVTYIPIETLVYLISFISKRKSGNLETKMRYYRNEDIRKIIWWSRFFETLKDVTGLTIYEIVTDLTDGFEKSKYAKDPLSLPRYTYTQEGESSILSEEERLEMYQKKGFYPLTSLKFLNDEEKSITLKEEPKKWTKSQQIISVIQRNLPDVTIGDNISKHIIYESITNSIRHPNSNHFLITSKRQNDYYTIVIWDNGKSIIDTLMDELKNGKSIKNETPSFDDTHSCYCVRKEDVEIKGKPKDTNFDFYFSYETPKLNDKTYRSEIWFILLSSLFPGISRDPEGLDTLPMYNKEPNFQNTGRGLMYLINAAVRIFGGEVRIRTGNYFINIQKADKKYKTLPEIFINKYKNDYYVIDYQKTSDSVEFKEKIILDSLFRAKFVKYHEEFGNLLGNMITIQIPQKNI